MQFRIIALAGAFALTSSFALAQAGGGNATGAEVPGNSGTAVNGSGGAVGTVNNGTMTREPTAPTTGTSTTGRSGPTVDGGGVDKSRVGGQGVSRKPGD